MKSLNDQMNDEMINPTKQKIFLAKHSKINKQNIFVPPTQYMMHQQQSYQN